MNRFLAAELQRVLERAGLRDPSLTAEDRHELLTLALRNTSTATLAYVHDALTSELGRRDVRRG